MRAQVPIQRHSVPQTGDAGISQLWYIARQIIHPVHVAHPPLRRLPMKRFLFVLAAIAVVAVGGFAMSTSAHADNTGSPSCSTSNC